MWLPTRDYGMRSLYRPLCCDCMCRPKKLPRTKLTSQYFSTKMHFFGLWAGPMTGIPSLKNKRGLFIKWKWFFALRNSNFWTKSNPIRHETSKNVGFLSIFILLGCPVALKWSGPGCIIPCSRLSTGLLILWGVLTVQRGECDSSSSVFRLYLDLFLR